MSRSILSQASRLVLDAIPDGDGIRLGTLVLVTGHLADLSTLTVILDSLQDVGAVRPADGFIRRGPDYASVRASLGRDA